MAIIRYGLCHLDLPRRRALLQKASRALNFEADAGFLRQAS